MTGKSLRAFPIKLRDLGLPEAFAPQVMHCVWQLQVDGVPDKAIRRLLAAFVRRPQQYREHPVLGELAVMLQIGHRAGAHPTHGTAASCGAPWQQWGDVPDPAAVQQMEDGCGLPVAVRGALMPDAHVGYGLPIGGVLAVDNAVIPYGVGMDIACRMKLSAFALPPDTLDKENDHLADMLERGTHFGVGASNGGAFDHPVMDEDWNFSAVTKKMKSTARAQLGTSGAGNHFVEWGLLDVPECVSGLKPGLYVALLSHSGSRGTGGEVARYYSALARRLHPELSRSQGHLAWLDMDSDAGREYWAAMELMGRYSAASHQLIHKTLAGLLGLHPVWSVENHHNFAWRETHDGRELIVHRKGATPAARGRLGIIPGTMVHPAYVVEGLGNPLSLHSAAHGAGRIMSRKAALQRFRRSDLEHVLHRHGVRLLSGGLDEVPMAYKDIAQVMAAQADLVRVRGTFLPRIVKMAS